MTAKNGGDFEWVEIVEPETNRFMYANVLTGDCRWDPPPGMPFKKNHDNQWWELFDANSGRSYYYNSSSHQTLWERPQNGDIIALAKLQKMQEEMALEEQRLREEEEEKQRQSQRQSSVRQKQQLLQQQLPPMHQRQGSGDHERPASPARGNGAAAAAAAASSPSASSVPVAPALPPAVAPKASRALSTEALEAYSENLSTHRKGFFRKKVSIASMLAWSKEGIKVPMLMTLKGKDKKDALEMFKLVQMYMGDRQTKFKDLNSCALECITRCWAVPAMRDELYLQICKQTTTNKRLDSCEKGWELMAIALSFFPPSNKFFSYLEGYIARHLQAEQPGRIVAYANYCVKRLERVGRTGAKRGTQAPGIEEIEHAKHAVFHPSVFDSTLEEVMEQQAQTYPRLAVPWVIVALAQAVLAHQGAQTEGIFRVPGDIDAVNALKIALDRGSCPDSFPDPHIPASALKLWFRELVEPLIPARMYDSCINAYDNAARCLAIADALPPVNRMVLMYIVRFLQTVGAPENQSLTKMTCDNLSMVWAPNFLRCPSDDPMVIFQNTKREMSFVRHLVLEWNTAEAADIRLA